jgi:hypothetical protein
VGKIFIFPAYWKLSTGPYTVIAVLIAYSTAAAKLSNIDGVVWLLPVVVTR